LDTLKAGVGYPGRWQDYSRLEIVKGDALGNARRAQLFESRPRDFFPNCAKQAAPRAGHARPLQRAP